jgi:transcriptional regulator with XRE-family HTH domain
MKSDKPKRIFRTRHLTPEEFARDEEIRRKIEAEFPPASKPRKPGKNSLTEMLKTSLRSSGRSFYQIAKESGVSPIVITRFLAGKRDIRMATADKLAGVLGLKLQVK